MREVVIKREIKLDPQEFRDVLVNSTLCKRRPIDNFDRIKKCAGIPT